ncbi:MAG: hypothetical protein JJU21_03260 [Salinarimonas sp.]|nr:hypothetical protein [Salinarimonas sp.]
MPLQKRNNQEPQGHARDAQSDGPDQLETARYVAALTAELSLMARRAELPLLSYFLEMARMEAANAAQPVRRAGKATRERQPPPEKT